MAKNIEYDLLNLVNHGIDWALQNGIKHDENFMWPVHLQAERAAGEWRSSPCENDENEIIILQAALLGLIWDLDTNRPDPEPFDIIKMQFDRVMKADKASWDYRHKQEKEKSKTLLQAVEKN
jgi:hypothetical protein